jgi:hypothetical protein
MGELGAWAISVLAWAISYVTQAGLAAGTGAFPGWQAWAWPATVDLAALIGMVLALDQARQKRPAATAWAVSLLAAAVMVAANTAADWPHPVAMLLHAWPPVIAIACWFLLVHVRRREPAAVVEEDAGTDADTDTEPVQPVPDLDVPALEAVPAERTRSRRRPRVENGRVREAASAVRESGRPVTSRTLAEELRVSERHGRRLLPLVEQGEDQ